MSGPTLTDGLWTKTTLAAQLVGELNIARNAAGGTVPDRVTNIISECYTRLWERFPWKYRRRLATLTLAAGVSSAQMPENFDKLDQDWVQSNNRKGPLRFTDDVQVFSDTLYQANSGNGTPRLALVVPDTSVTTYYAMKVMVDRAPAEQFTYPYWYLCLAPALDATAYPLWPRQFMGIWHDYATFRLQRAFQGGDEWKETYGAFKVAVAEAIDENNETLKNSTEAIQDFYGDLNALPSTMQSSGVAGIWLD